MTGVLNQFVVVGEESTAYGTKATTLTRAFEAMGDDFEAEIEHIEDNAHVRNREGTLSNRRRPVVKGASGSLEHCFLTSGEGMLLEHCFGNASVGAAAAKSSVVPSKAMLHKFNTQAAPPTNSLTVHVARQMFTGASGAEKVEGFDYLGGVITSWSLSVEVDGKVMFTPTFDFREEKKATAETGPAYQTGAGKGEFFIWEDCTISLGNSAVDGFNSFDLEVDMGYDTERYFIEGTSLKEKPRRVRPIAVTGTISGEARTFAQYDKWFSGALESFVFQCVHPTAIETKTGQMWNASLKITIPKIQYDGSTPKMQLDGLSTIDVPFTGLQENVANLSTVSKSLISAEYVTLDSAV